MERVLQPRESFLSKTHEKAPVIIGMYQIFGFNPSHEFYSVKNRSSLVKHFDGAD